MQPTQQGRHIRLPLVGAREAEEAAQQPLQLARRGLDTVEPAGRRIAGGAAWRISSTVDSITVSMLFASCMAFGANCAISRRCSASVASVPP